MLPSAFFISLRSMQLTRLKAANFRNFSTIEFVPDARMNILYGPNGSGKTNLLESIFLICLGRSQRGYSDGVLIKNGEETYRVEGQFTDGDSAHEVAVAYSNRSRKQITIDGVKSRLSELYEHFNAVAIGPEDSDILSGPPSSRRLFLDLYISQLSKKYLEELTRYNRIVSQKNAALKDGLEFDSFNELMIDSGAKIMNARGNFLKDLEENCVQYYDRFSGGSKLGIKYLPSAFDDQEWDEKVVESQFKKKLDEIKEKEQILKTSMTGPHRDEIEFQIDQLPARTHGSQGEWRSTAVALKLAVMKLIREKRRKSPVLLLDEVFAELDNDRTGALIDSFGDFEQLFLTTASRPPKQLLNNARSFEIKNGLINSVD